MPYSTATEPISSTPSATTHLCNVEHRAAGTMQNLYANLRCYPTSINGDIVLIRSYLAYWYPQAEAERATIKPSRGHSYRVKMAGSEYIAKISDYYDHRDGVTLARVEAR